MSLVGTSMNVCSACVSSFLGCGFIIIIITPVLYCRSVQSVSLLNVVRHFGLCMLWVK